MLSRKEYVDIRMKYFGEDFFEAYGQYPKYQKHKEMYPDSSKANQVYVTCGTVANGTTWVDPFSSLNSMNSLCTYPVPAASIDHACSYAPAAKEKAKGNNPMRYEQNAIATVSAPKSDIATQREYLTNRLQKAEYAKEDELVKHFNLYVNNAPKSPQQLIDMIKDNKYTVDTERFDRANKRPGYYPIFDGIVWDGPKPDRDGYDAAAKEMTSQKTAAKDAIMVFSAEDGLKAVQAFEAWMPEGKAN